MRNTKKESPCRKRRFDWSRFHSSDALSIVLVRALRAKFVAPPQEQCEEAVTRPSPFRLNNCFRVQSYALWNYCTPTGHYWVLWPFLRCWHLAKLQTHDPGHKQRLYRRLIYLAFDFYSFFVRRVFASWGGGVSQGSVYGPLLFQKQYILTRKVAERD